MLCRDKTSYLVTYITRIKKSIQTKTPELQVEIGFTSQKPSSSDN